MGFTKGGKKFGAKPRSARFGDKPGFVKRDGPRPDRTTFSKNKFELFDATCGNCGKACQVPFRPNGSRPVLCKDCFGRKEEYPPKGMSRSAMRGEREGSDELQEINEKLDKIMRALKIN